MSFCVVGDIMVDVVACHEAPLAHGSDTPARVGIRPGGAAGNVAAWLAEAGARVTVVARVGDDALAAVALEGLDAVARVVRDGGRPTGTCVVLVDAAGERTMLPDPGANERLAIEDVPPPDPGGVLYLSGYSLLRPASRGAARATLDRARAAGTRTVVDPASAAPLASAAEFLDWAGDVDLLLANADEAAVLGDAMHRAAREVVVKRGSEGATWSDGAREVRVPAVAARAVDTTGAGDAFAAGFLSRWDEGPEIALAAGAALAARAVAVVGARPRG